MHDASTGPQIIIQGGSIRCPDKVFVLLKDVIDQSVFNEMTIPESPSPPSSLPDVSIVSLVNQ